jgi:hypothetical protein
MSNPPLDLSSFGMYGLMILQFVPFVVLHLILSSAVYSDARRLVTATGRGCFLGGPVLWWFATLLGGLFAVGLYWVIHHSQLRPPPPVT